MIVHPISGEVLVDRDEAALDDLPLLEEVEADVDGWLRGEYAKLRRIREGRDEIRGAIAELRGASRLPAPRYRTPTQQRVAECPRCMGVES